MRKELRTVVVFCEGKRSEPDYIRAVKQLPGVKANTSLKLELEPVNGVPLTLVEQATVRSQDPEVDECWCVFDVEWPQRHPNLDRAVSLAKEHSIRLAISNPCFELWLILHFEDFNKCATTDMVERKSRTLDRREGKALKGALYMERRREAIRRAELLAKRHLRDGTAFPNDNPSSGVYLLLQSVEGHGSAEN